MINYAEKKAIIFDLDGTLTKSKCKIDEETALLLKDLIKKKEVVIVSGGPIEQFQKQVLPYLAEVKTDFTRLYLYPTSGASFYKWCEAKQEWCWQYKNLLSEDDKFKIIDAFETAFKKINYEFPTRTYGEIFEDRETQVTFSALGQEAPLEKKETWDPDATKRKAIKQILDELLPEFHVRIGGKTSIDVTLKRIDKAYCINHFSEFTGHHIQDLLFMGDALYEGGNDYSVKTTGVECIAVADPEATKHVIRSMLRN